MADEEKEKEPFFKIYNKEAVEKIKKDEKIELPKRQLDIPKDERWNEKQLASKTMHGIMNGDSIQTISKSMKEVIKNNETSVMRVARTMYTSSENAGRLQSFKDLSSQGVVQKKVWQATPDDRVRASHLDIDGEEQEIDMPFSNGCMFPGDGKGPSEEVWNCRCNMNTRIIGFRRADGSISEVNYNGEETLHDKQIRARREKQKVSKASTFIIDFEKHALKMSKNELLYYIQSHDENLVWEMAFKSEDEIRDTVKEMMKQNATVDINGKSYRHIEKYAFSDMNALMIGNTQDASNIEKYYVQTSESYKINSAIRNDSIDSLSNELKDTIHSMDTLISQNELPDDITFIRFADEKYLANILGVDEEKSYFILDNSDVCNGLDALKDSVITEKSFMSVSTDINANAFTNYPIRLDIIADKGTNAYITKNADESEVIFGRGTKYKVEDVAVVYNEETKKNNISMIVRIINE